MRGLDLSYDAHLVTAEWIARRKAEGWGMLIACLWTGKESPEGVEQALRLAREGGMLTAGYYVPHAFRPPGEHLNMALQAAGAEWEHLSFVALDVEDINSGDPMPVQWEEDHLRQSVLLLNNLRRRPVIYTSERMWGLAWIGDFSDLPLWFAGDSHDFGGWTSYLGHQYQGTTLLDGIRVDLNEFSDNLGGTMRTPEQQAILDQLNGWSGRVDSPDSISLREAAGQLSVVVERLRRLEHSDEAEAIGELVMVIADAAAQLGDAAVLAEAEFD